MIPDPQRLRKLPGVRIHETAWLDAPCEIGERMRIWHFSHVQAGARIGRNCVLGQNVNVGEDVRIGNNVKIQNNVSVYAGCEIEDDVFLGPSCVLTNISNPRAEIVRKRLYESTRFLRGATVGANATIVCGITLGRYCFIGAGAVVTKDVPDYALMLGNPARRRGWISRHGHPLNRVGEGDVMVCPESGLRYRQEGPKLCCLDLDEEAPLPDQWRVGKARYRDLDRETD